MNMTESWDGTGVTTAALKTEVIRLAEESPDRQAACVYTTSVYDYDKEEEVLVKPECIVGTAVYNITGKLVPPFFEASNIKANRWREKLDQIPLSSDYAEANADNSDADFLFVLALQGLQDNGHTWGAALTSTRDRYES
jgi:hypothetical protein